MPGRFTNWLAATFGAAPADAPAETLAVVFEGSPAECQIVALRLKAEGFFVDPDPSPRVGGFGSPRADLRSTSRRRGPVSTMAVSVLATDEARARAVLDAVEPI